MSLVTYQNSTGKTQIMSDRLAMVLSSLCILHCIATPLLLVAVPSLAAYSIFSGETLHHALLFFILPVGLLALTLGFRHHKQAWVLSMGIIGLVLLCSPMLLESPLMAPLHIDLHDLGENSETYITIVASIFVVIAHTANYRLRQTNTSYTQAQ
jgi:hypothetical protein